MKVETVRTDGRRGVEGWNEGLNQRIGKGYASLECKIAA